MSGSNKRRLICWDSCVFLAWFKEEKDKPLSAIEKILSLISEGEVNLLISAVSYAEVLDRAGESSAGTQFRGFAKRTGVIVANVDPRIGETAAKIRETAVDQRAKGEMTKGVGIPDAMIVATALTYKATELHTFDPVLLQGKRMSDSFLVQGLREG